MVRIALAFVLLASVGCASGPKGDAVALPAVGAGKARVVFYRASSPIAALDQPNILLDGVVVGKSESGYFSYVDVAPGRHLIESKGGEANRIAVEAAPGATAYVETSIKPLVNNWAVTVQQKPEAEAKKTIAGLHFRPAVSAPAAAGSKTRP